MWLRKRRHYPRLEYSAWFSHNLYKATLTFSRFEEHAIKLQNTCRVILRFLRNLPQNWAVYTERIIHPEGHSSSARSCSCSSTPATQIDRLHTSPPILNPPASSHLHNPSSSLQHRTELSQELADIPKFQSRQDSLFCAVHCAVENAVFPPFAAFAQALNC
jgi:hypothetical protein